MPQGWRLSYDDDDDDDYDSDRGGGGFVASESYSSFFAVGGVMAFLTLHEMLPLAFDYAGQKQAVKAVFLGMAFMSARSAYIGDTVSSFNIFRSDVSYFTLLETVFFFFQKKSPCHPSDFAFDPGLC